MDILFCYYNDTNYDTLALFTMKKSVSIILCFLSYNDQNDFKYYIHVVIRIYILSIL